MGSSTGNALRPIVAAFVRGRSIFAAVLLGTVGVVALYVLVSPRIYRAQTTLIVEPSERENPLRGIALPSGDRDVLVELQVLQSMDLATRVADELDGYRSGNEPEQFPLLVEFDGSDSGKLALAQALQERIEVEQVRRDIGVIEIGFRSTGAEESKAVANLFASEYAARNMEASRVRASGLRSFVQQQLTDNRDKLNAVEEQLESFQTSESAFSLDEEARTLSRQMADLQTMLDQAQVELEMVTAQREALEKEYAQIEPNLSARVSAAGLEREISTLQEEIAQLEFDIEQRYAKNPGLHGNEVSDRAISALIAQAEVLKEQVRIKADRYVAGVLSSGGVDPERQGQSAIPATLTYVSSLRRSITEKNISVAALKARIDVLSRRIVRYQRDFNKIPGQARVVAGLQRDRGSTEQTQAWLNEKYEEARIAEESEFGSVRILDVAYLPTEPVSPRAKHAFLLGGLLGLILAALGVFVRELLDESVLDPGMIRRSGLQLVGVIPQMRFRGRDKNRGVNELVVVESPDSRAGMSLQHIVTRLDGSEGTSCSVLLVTSPGTGEGKSMVASNVAAALASAGHRTLLLDANIWRPRVHDLLGTTLDSGLTGLLFGSALMADAIRKTVIPELHVICAGKMRPDKFTLLASRDFAALMTYLRAAFDRIVIDGAGIHSAGSALGLTPLADRILVVARASKTNGDELIECVTELTDRANGPVLVLLNGFDGREAFGSYSKKRPYGSYGRREGRRRPVPQPSQISSKESLSGDGANWPVNKIYSPPSVPPNGRAYPTESLPEGEIPRWDESDHSY